MDSVLTIIGGSESLTPAALDGMMRRLARADCVPAKIDWLSQGESCDLYIARAPSFIRAAVAATCADTAYDFIAQPVQGRRKKLLLADMESTLIEEELLDEIAGETGLREQIANITARAMNGELDFAAALKARVALLRGTPVAALEHIAARIRLVPGAACLIATLKKHGAPCYIATGGFAFFADRVAQALGASGCFSNSLEIRDGNVTGEVLPPILDKSSKLAALKDLAARHRITLAETAAIGDGANDLEMLKAAGLGIGFRAKPILARQVSQIIRHGDLRGMLFAQGYRASELAAA